MPRPKRLRIVSSVPKCQCFTSSLKDKKVTTLHLEEYEALRLMDYLNLTHDEAATMMNISRTTVTEIYESARKKMAKALCEGTDLIIDGGNFKICTDQERISNLVNAKEGKNMKTRIAVTYDNGEVFQHFGKSEAFKIYEVEDKKVTRTYILSSNGQGHGQLAVLLLNEHVDLLICGGIGGGAVNALGQAGIKVLPGVSGNTDKVIEDFLNETLTYNPDYQCDHHGEHEHHDCDCGDAHHEHHCGCGDHHN